MLTGAGTSVYLALGGTDMRKSINGLSILVQDHLNMDPFSGNLFVFRDRRRTIVKVLYRDANGFCVWMKRLEKQFFKWPSTPEEVLEIDRRQLNWLLDGLELRQPKAHAPLYYSTLV